MKRLALFALLALVPALAQADDPPKPPAPPVAAVVVNPPGPVDPGTLVTLDASASTGDTLLWDSDVAATLYRQDTNGRLVYFATATPGTYLFRLDSFALQGGKIAAGRAKVAVTVRAADPPPVVTPPVVTPPTPDPLGMAGWTRTTLKTITWTPEALRFRQGTLGPIFSTVAANAATYPTGQAMLVDLETRYKAAIGPDLWASFYRDTLFGPMQAQLLALQKAGKFKDVPSLVEAITEIGNALKEGN